MTGSSPTPPGHRLAELVHAAAAWVADRWPLLAALAVAVTAVATTVRTVVDRRRHARLHDGARWVGIAPPPRVDPAGATALWLALAGLLAPPRRRWWPTARQAAHIGFEYVWAGRRLTIGLWVPGTMPADVVAAAVRAAWPGASATTGPAVPPVPLGGRHFGGVYTLAHTDAYPLRVDHDSDPLRPLAQVGTLLREHDNASLQILARPATGRHSRRLRTAAARIRAGGTATRRSWADPAPLVRTLLDPFTSTTRPRGASTPARRVDPAGDRDTRQVTDKATAGPHFHTAIRWCVSAAERRGAADPPEPAIRTLVAAAAAFAARNQLRPLPARRPAGMLAGRRLRGGFLLSVPELAALAGLPRDLAVPGLARAQAQAVPAPVQVPTGGRNTKALGRAEAGGHAVAVPMADLRHHAHVIGATGSGKSTLLCTMCVRDILAGRGVIVIDPKGDLVNDILERLPADVAARIVLIDPAQTHTPALNPLDGHDPDLAVDNIVSIFSKTFTRHWGPRMDDVLRVACLTLMRKANPTLTLVPPLLLDKRFRAAFTHDLNDPEGLLGFWEWYETMPAALRGQVIAPVLARLRNFALRDFVHRTLGPPKSSFDMSAILDGGVLLCRLPKGQIGDETARLLGSFVLANAWQAATARAGQPEGRRRDAAIYVDEAHNFLNLAGSVDDMLAEARGYRISLVLAHQNLAQLPAPTAAAISANARNKIYFACAPEDATSLARHTEPELTDFDLSHLDAYTAAARLVVAGRQTPAFTLRTEAPLPVVGEATAIRQACAATAAAATGRPRTAIETMARR